jgi:hypothetical protein
MISASAPIFTKGEFPGGFGAIVVATIFAVEVGERWRVIGCGGCLSASDAGIYAGLGTARTWFRKLSSRNWA